MIFRFVSDRRRREVACCDLRSSQLTKKGDIPVIFKQADGTQVRGTLQGVKVSPSVEHRLFSLTSAMSKGAKLGSDSDNNITLTLNNRVIRFDRRLRTRSGSIQGVEIIPDLDHLRQRRAEENERALNMRHARSPKHSQYRTMVGLLSILSS